MENSYSNRRFIAGGFSLTPGYLSGMCSGIYVENIAY